MFWLLATYEQTQQEPMSFPIRFLFGSDELSTSVVLNSPLSHNVF